MNTSLILKIIFFWDKDFFNSTFHRPKGQKYFWTKHFFEQTLQTHIEKSNIVLSLGLKAFLNKTSQTLLFFYNLVYKLKIKKYISLTI